MGSFSNILTFNIQVIFNMQREHTVVGLLVNRLAALAQALLVLINA